MRLLFAALLFCVFSTGLYSQPHYFELQNLEMPPWRRSFQIDSVIDARAEKEVIGYVFDGSFEDRRPAHLKGSLREFLSKNVTAKGATQEKLLLRVNHLYVQDVIKFGRPMATVELNVSFLKKENNTYTELFEAGAVVSHIGQGAMAGIDGQLAEALAQCFNDFEFRRNANKLQGETLPPIEVSSPHKSLTYLIHVKTALKKGLYHSFYDFRDNLPDTVTTFFPEYFEDKNLHSTIAKIEVIKADYSTDSLFAFSDGRSLFVRARNRYVQLLDSAGRFFMDWYPVHHSKYIGGMLTADEKGGVRNLTIHSQLDYSDKKQWFTLDLRTGEVFSADRIKQEDILGQSIFYSSSFNPKDQQMELLINGEKVCALSRGDYYIHETYLTSQSLEVCLAYGEQKVCQTITPEMLNTAIFRCRFARKNKLEINQLFGTSKDDFYNALKYDEAMQVCPAL